MPLLLNEAAERGDAPGFHALIIGISAYPHLSQPTPPEPPTLGLRQLSSPAITAYRIANWLITRRAYLPVPLTTCRVMLLPSAVELAAGGEPLAALRDECARTQVLVEAAAWRADASRNADSMTLFYFAGHGVQRNQRDHVMLLAGFGRGIGPLLEDAIDTTNLLAGMAPTTARPKMARTQMYFIDACRVRPKVFARYEDSPSGKLWDVEVDIVDDRTAPLFHTAVPGAKAYAVKGKQTVFSQALLECLTGGAGREVEPRADGTPPYGVTINSLRESLPYHLDRINREHGTRARFEVQGGGYGGQRVIHWLDSPPLVDVTLELHPSEAHHHAGVRVVALNDNPDNRPSWDLAPVIPHPYCGSLPMGIYLASARIEPPAPYVDNGLAFSAIPPNHRVRIPLLG